MCVMQRELLGPHLTQCLEKVGSSTLALRSCDNIGLKRKRREEKEEKVTLHSFYPIVAKVSGNKVDHTVSGVTFFSGQDKKQ